VLTLLQNPEICDRMGRAARARYLKKFTQEQADRLLHEWLVAIR
jgi:hypothetical protein